MKFSIYEVTRQGGRPLNEDRLSYQYSREAVVMVLADGMGGHPDGEQAADIAVNTFTQRFAEQARPRLADAEVFLVDALLAAHEAILAHARREGMPESPRTTVVAAVIQDGQLTYVHSGDSRLYWVRGGQLLSRTRDHSYQERADLFKNAPATLNRSVLFTCLGSPVKPIYDLSGPRLLRQSDRLLLCSDGLWGVMEDADVAQGLFEHPLRDALTQLTERALSKGGEHGDNVSLLGLEWDTPDQVDMRDPGGIAFAPTQPAEPQLDGLEVHDLTDEMDQEELLRSFRELDEEFRRKTPGKP